MAFDGTLWSRRVKLTGLTPSSSLTGYVSFISLSNLPTEMVDAGSESALNGGGDIRVSTDDAGVNQLPLDIVSFVTNASPGSRECQMWVRFPTYSSGSRELYLFYGKSGETQPAVGASFGRNENWQDYDSVWHFNESSGDFIDSTGYSDISVISESGITRNVVGQFGNAASFLGVADGNLLFGTSSTTNPLWNIGMDEFTLQTWASRGATDSTGPNMVLEFGGASNGGALYYRSGPNTVHFGLSNVSNPSGVHRELDSTSNFFAGDSFSFAGRYDLGKQDLIVNGLQEATGTNGTTLNSQNSQARVASYSATGAHTQAVGSTTNFQPWDGTISELRRIQIALSNDYLSLEQSNYLNVSTFWTTSSPEDTVSGFELSPSIENYDYEDFNSIVNLNFQVSPAFENYEYVDYNASLSLLYVLNPNIENYEYLDFNSSLTINFSSFPNFENYNYSDYDVSLSLAYVSRPSIENYDYTDFNSTMTLNFQLSSTIENYVYSDYDSSISLTYISLPNSEDISYLDFAPLTFITTYKNTISFSVFINKESNKNIFITDENIFNLTITTEDIPFNLIIIQNNSRDIFINNEKQYNLEI